MSGKAADHELSVENVPRPPGRKLPPDYGPFEQAWPNGTRQPEIGAVVLDRDGWAWQRRVDDIDAWESLRTWYELGDGHTSVKAWSWLQEHYGPLLLLARRDGQQDDIPWTEFEIRNLLYAMTHPERTSENR